MDESTKLGSPQRNYEVGNKLVNIFKDRCCFDNYFYQCDSYTPKITLNSLFRRYKLPQMITNKLKVQIL